MAICIKIVRLNMVNINDVSLCLFQSPFIIIFFQNINDLISQERPDWQSIMSYVTSIYKHFET